MSKWIVLLLAAVAPVLATELPDIKSEKFTVVEKSDAAAVALSEPKQETKDVRGVWVLIYYASVSENGTQAILGHVEVNCTLSQVKYGVGYRLGVDTSVIGTMTPHTPDWQVIHPNSPSGDLYEHVCGRPATPNVETKISYTSPADSHSYSEVNRVSSHSPSESWDQANLKRDDRGCPTAIYYVNPKTKLLEQCP